MSKLFTLLNQRPACCAFIMAIFAAGIAALLHPFGLQNDDLQIYFMLLNGGQEYGHMGYGLYTHYALGWCIAQASRMFPTINVYLLFLFSLSFVACCSANFYVLNAQAAGRAVGGRYWKVLHLASLLSLLLINVVCLSNLQYTHVAIWSAVCGILLLSSIEKNSQSIIRVILACGLLLGAYSLRESSIVSAMFIGAVALVWKCKNKKLWGYCAIIVLFIAALQVMNNMSYKASSEWQSARCYLQARVKILDSPDNSGVDKSFQLEKMGISPQSFSLFKSFIYTPSMDDVALVERCVPLHREGRKGMFGSSVLADIGFLEAPLYTRFGKNHTLFQYLTPWVPLILASFLYLVGISRRTLLSAAMMLCAVVCYVVILIALQRMVGRVLNPILYAASLWLLTLPPHKSKYSENRLICAFVGCVCLACVLFFTRHWHIGSRAEAAHQYCMQHPDTLYLTTCQQGLGLYPMGFCGYSFGWLQRANILPIADGWSFYTPAYKAALQARGFASLQDAMLHPNTRIIVRDNGLSMTTRLKQLALCEWGKKIEFSVVDTYGGFHFVKAIEK